MKFLAREAGGEAPSAIREVNGARVGIEGKQKRQGKLQPLFRRLGGLRMHGQFLMRLIGDHIHRVFLSFLPVSTILAYGSSAALVLLIRWAKHGKPRGYPVAWLQHQFRPKAHSARWSDPPLPYLVEDAQ